MPNSAADLALNVAFFRSWITELRDVIDARCDELTRLDAAIGDADHGVNMLRGMQAVVAALDGAAATPADVLGTAGTRLVAVVGGAAGPLYGTAFRSMAASLEGVASPTLADLATALEAGLAGIQQLGAAQVGDKTIVDAWIPAVDALKHTSDRPQQAFWSAAAAARKGMVSTVPMRARKGRASYLGWRSEGHQDPGATSTALLFESLAAAAG